MENPFKKPLSLVDAAQWPVPFSQEDWDKTPEAVRAYIPWLHQRIVDLEKMNHRLSQDVDDLKSRQNRNSSNSNQPPSSDPPYRKKPKKRAGGKKPGGKKGHKGHRQQMLEPTQTVHLKPRDCACGNKDFPETQPFYTHQFIELPKIEMEVTHFVLHQGTAAPVVEKPSRPRCPTPAAPATAPD